MTKTSDDEPAEQRRDSHRVSLHDIRDRLFARSQKTEKFLRDLNIRTIYNSIRITY